MVCSVVGHEYYEECILAKERKKRKRKSDVLFSYEEMCGSIADARKEKKAIRRKVTDVLNGKGHKRPLTKPKPR